MPSKHPASKSQWAGPIYAIIIFLVGLVLTFVATFIGSIIGAAIVPLKLQEFGIPVPFYCFFTVIPFLCLPVILPMVGGGTIVSAWKWESGAGRRVWIIVATLAAFVLIGLCLGLANYLIFSPASP